jgi:hypothetical protein
MFTVVGIGDLVHVLSELVQQQQRAAAAGQGEAEQSASSAVAENAEAVRVALAKVKVLHLPNPWDVIQRQQLCLQIVAAHVP